MKCPKCGATNGKTNKFCRGCGFKVEGIAQIAEHLDAPELEHDISHLDDLALGEELFSVMKLYDDGDLETAEERIAKIIESYPESASALSIMGLIYERKADIETEAGNSSSAHSYLQLAVSQYESIINLNPKSGADREKLVSLRMKLVGRTSPKPDLMPHIAVSAVSAIGANAKNFLKKVPTPALISVGAFLVLAILFSALIPRGGKSGDEMAVPRYPQSANGLEVTTNTSAPSQPSIPANANTELRVYNYPTAPAAPKIEPVQTLTPPQVPRLVEPLRLPNVVPELVLVPEQRKPSVAPKIRAIPAPVADLGDTAPSAVDGSTLLVKAITLGNQQRYAEAISVAQQAASLFQSDLAAGSNVIAARRGLDNANKYIELWQSSEAQ